MGGNLEKEILAGIHVPFVCYHVLLAFHFTGHSHPSYQSYSVYKDNHNRLFFNQENVEVTYDKESFSKCSKVVLCNVTPQFSPITDNSYGSAQNV